MFFFYNDSKIVVSVGCCWFGSRCPLLSLQCQKNEGMISLVLIGDAVGCSFFDGVGDGVGECIVVPYCIVVSYLALLTGGIDGVGDCVGYW